MGGSANDSEARHRTVTPTSGDRLDYSEIIMETSDTGNGLSLDTLQGGWH